jgi:transposase
MSNKKYDEAYKRNAVRLVESGQSAARVARDLGLRANQVYAWRKRYGATASVHGNASQNQDEVTHLRKELERTQMELDILKKAISIFSRPGAPHRQ